MTKRTKHPPAPAKPEDIQPTKDRLAAIAKIQNVDPSFFFEQGHEARWAVAPDSERVRAFVASDEGRKLVTLFLQIEDPTLRQLAIDLVLSICRYSSTKM